jgi:hypothetical protein
MMVEGQQVLMRYINDPNTMRYRKEREELKQKLDAMEIDWALQKRDLEKANGVIVALQKQTLSSVDRFKPVADRDVIRVFEATKGKVKTLSNFLAKHLKSELSDDKLIHRMMENA